MIVDMRKKSLMTAVVVAISVVMPMMVSAEYCVQDSIRYWIVNNEHLKVDRFLDKRFTEELVIPDSVWVETLGKRLPVKGAGEKMLAECSVASLILPSTLTYNDKNSFGCCSALVNVDLSKTKITGLNLLTSIPSNICTITLPNVLEVIGSNAFTNTQIRECVLPSSLMYIFQCSFKGTPIEKVTFKGSTLEMLSAEAFCDCENLYEIDLPEVFWFDHDCFRNTNISELTIGAGTGILMNYCFSGMQALTSVKSFITNPETIVYYHDVTEESRATKSGPFANQDLSNCTLYVPEGSVELYRNHERWQGFKEILPLDGSGIPTVATDGTEEEETEMYDLMGRRVNQVVPGQIYIANGRKFIAGPSAK